MDIKFIDFELVTRHYKNYREGVDKLLSDKEKFTKEVDPIRTRINSIINEISSNIVTDQRTDVEKNKEFKQLQNKLIAKNKEFEESFEKKQTDLNKQIYSDLSKIIEEYSNKNNINVVMSKIETVYVQDDLDITNNILDVLKEKNLWVDYIETEDEKIQK